MVWLASISCNNYCPYNFIHYDMILRYCWRSSNILSPVIAWAGRVSSPVRPVPLSRRSRLQHNTVLVQWIKKIIQMGLDHRGSTWQSTSSLGFSGPPTRIAILSNANVFAADHPFHHIPVSLPHTQVSPIYLCSRACCLVNMAIYLQSLPICSLLHLMSMCHSYYHIQRLANELFAYNAKFRPTIA
jgi:hypothetical protein